MAASLECIRDIVNPTPSPPQIPDQDNARRAKPGEPFTFTGESLDNCHFSFDTPSSSSSSSFCSCLNRDLTVDASKTGWGEVAIDVVYENK